MSRLKSKVGGQQMEISYDKLWKLMIDKKINKTQLSEKAGITTNAMAKLGKNESVQIEILAKICKVLDCNIEDIAEVYPNPSKGEFSYKVNSDFDNLYIYDLKGTIVHKQSFMQRQDKVNASNLKEGVYFVRFFKKGQAGKTVKIIIEK